MIKNCILSLALALAFVSLSFASAEYREMYSASGGTKTVLVVVKSGIYEPIRTRLKQYTDDLSAEGYSITVTALERATPQELKDYIKLFRDLAGVVLIGDLPVPFFEIEDDFAGENDVAGEEKNYALFPCDIFYMDLDGTWEDKNNNGFYDAHSGAMAPEIWVCRLFASTVHDPQRDEVSLLKNYFAKNHTYRTGKSGISQRGLVYVDDPWVESMGTSSLENVYPEDITLVNDALVTTVADYKDKLKENFEWLQMAAHSGFYWHQFYNSDKYEYILSNEILETVPVALFYNLYACSATLYAADSYIGGSYLFANKGGLAVIGSTKSGGMGSYNYFYPYLGPAWRFDIGDSFKYWLMWHGLDDPLIRSWYYGMVILGDATLTLDPPIAAINFVMPYPFARGRNRIIFSGAGKSSTGKIAEYSWRSDRDGYLSNKKSFYNTTLSPGKHTVYLKVKDDKGRWSSEDKRAVYIGRGLR